MDSTALQPVENMHKVSTEDLISPLSDTDEVFQPANEFRPPTDTDPMDVRSDDAVIEPASVPSEVPEPTKEPSAASSSISIDSRTSTLKYSQEPFDQYQVRVKKLCHVLWPSEPQKARGTSGVARSRIFDAVRAKKLRRVLFPSTEKKFTIERLAGGTYNRIVGISFKNLGTDDLKKLILRVPRPQMAFYGYIEREVAILRYVRQETTLPVADIISFDPTINNPLGSGYVVQSRLPGVSLHAVWDELTHEQRCTVAQDVGEIILALQSVTNPVPGIVEASSASDNTQKFSVRQFDIKSPYDDDWKAKIPARISDEGVESTTQNAREWFGTQFGRWLVHELHDNPSQILWWDYQFQFVQVTKQMDALDLLDGESCLCHFDLAARNILVEILPDGSITTSGVVDWDSAAFAPKFVSCAPPSWLWTDQKLYDTDEGEARSIPSTPEQKEIKEAFDEVVGFDWTWLAYRQEYRLARELFYFAQHGLQDGEAQKKAVRFLKEWETLYGSLTNASKDGKSSKTTPDRDED